MAEPKIACWSVVEFDAPATDYHMKMVPSVLFIAGSFLVTAVFVANRIAPDCLRADADTLSAYFTALGFVGLIAVFVHERGEAAGAEQDHKDLIETMKMDRRAQLLRHKRDYLAAELAKYGAGHAGDNEPKRVQVRAALKQVDDELEVIYQYSRPA